MYRTLTKKQADRLFGGIKLKKFDPRVDPKCPEGFQYVYVEVRKRQAPELYCVATKDLVEYDAKPPPKFKNLKAQ